MLTNFLFASISIWSYLWLYLRFKTVCACHYSIVGVPFDYDLACIIIITKRKPYALILLFQYFLIFFPDSDLSRSLYYRLLMCWYWWTNFDNSHNRSKNCEKYFFNNFWDFDRNLWDFDRNPLQIVHNFFVGHLVWFYSWFLELLWISEFSILRILIVITVAYSICKVFTICWRFMKKNVSKNIRSVLKSKF